MSLTGRLKNLEARAQEVGKKRRPKEIYRYVVIIEGEPLTEQQSRDLAYNKSLQNPAAVGFRYIFISRSNCRSQTDGDEDPEKINDLPSQV